MISFRIECQMPRTAAFGMFLFTVTLTMTVTLTLTMTLTVTLTLTLTMTVTLTMTLTLTMTVTLTMTLTLTMTVTLTMTLTVTLTLTRNIQRRVPVARRRSFLAPWQCLDFNRVNHRASSNDDVLSVWKRFDFVERSFRHGIRESPRISNPRGIDKNDLRVSDRYDLSRIGKCDCANQVVRTDFVGLM
jgi:hypothetical protein